MRKYLHLVLIIIFFQNHYAQKYQPYDTNMVWKVFQTGSVTFSASNTCVRTEAYN